MPKSEEIDSEFLKINDQLECYLNVINDDNTSDNQNEKITEYDEEAEQSDDDINYDVQSSALKVIEDIDKRQIFDDIRIDFDSIVDNIAPEDNPSRLNQMLVSYYEEIHEVLQKRLEECQDIIEEYMTQLIESKKKNFQKHMQEIAQGKKDDISIINYSQKSSIIDTVTSEHNRRLTQLRDQYEQFLKNAEGEFFNVLRSVKGGSDSNSEFNPNMTKEKYLNEGHTPQQQMHNYTVDHGKSRKFGKIANEDKSFSEHHNSMSKNQFQNEQMYQSKSSVRHSKKEENKDTPKFTHLDSIGKLNSKVNENLSDEKLVDLSSDKNSESVYAPLKMSASKRIHEKQQLAISKVYEEDKSTIYLWGSGKDGRLANGNEISAATPNLVKTTYGFEQIECGYHHSAAITNQGELVAWGRGVYGQLGLGGNQSVATPTLIKSLSGVSISLVTCGWQHTMALTQQGKVLSWGYGEDGQLGHGDSNDCLSPKLVQALKDLTIYKIA